MYVIKKFKEEEVSNSIWENVEAIKIENYPWDKTGYKPSAEVKLIYTEKGIRVKFTATDEIIRVEVDEFNGPVYQDSCVETFLIPDPSKDQRYFNFETNAKGTLLLQLDDKIRERQLLEFVNPNYFNIVTDINSENYSEYDNYKPWTLEYIIPFEFIKVFFKDFEAESGRVMRANFSKCGDKTINAHYGTWSPIEEVKPAFHRPQFFKEIMFE